MANIPDCNVETVHGYFGLVIEMLTYVTSRANPKEKKKHPSVSYDVMCEIAEMTDRVESDDGRCDISVNFLSNGWRYILRSQKGRVFVSISIKMYPASLFDRRRRCNVEA
jgi:hypothetical protein